jgi:hypothetical protein
MTNVVKNHCFGKAKKGKVLPIKKWPPSQLQINLLKIAHLEALMTSMVTQVKANAPILGKVREQENSPSLA